MAIVKDKEECDTYLINYEYKIEYCKHDHTYNKIAIL